ncbi:MAG: hypothetical protein SCH98_06635 [Deferrisomatales bacterium]|nr:hypothetical protein [Deferrisomatales bacterium]
MERWDELLTWGEAGGLAVLLGLLGLLAATAGGGRRALAWRRTAWVAVLVLAVVSLTLGLSLGEWGTVLLNGQLL